MKLDSRHKAYLKINIVSLFFIFVSFISVTLAWFAYSGIAKVGTQVDVKAWYVEFQKGSQTVSNDVVISLDDIYPGMTPSTESITIKNLGDSNAQLKYKIVSARILDDSADNYVSSETVESTYIEDAISHNYPFHIDVNLSKNYAEAKTGESTFNVSVSWPLDSDNNAQDSLWGQKAYTFQNSEQTKLAADSSYQVQPSLKVIISVTAEQYVEESTSVDPKYQMGNLILYDVVSNHTCTELSTTCLKTHVIDINNTLGDTTVSLLPDVYTSYASGTYDNYTSLLTSATTSWAANKRALTVNDILNIISSDVSNSVLVRSNISDSVIGYLKYGTRIDTELTKAINYSGYYKFKNTSFTYLPSTNCYWTSTSYNTANAFAVKKIDDDYAEVYGETKTNTCNVVPVIVASKTNME